MKMKTDMDIRRIFRNSVRLYFAPITGAIKEVRREMSRIHREQHQQISSPDKHQV